MTNLCNICHNDIDGNLIGCDICKNELCNVCYEKVLKFDNNRFVIKCPYCRSCENANIKYISKTYLLNKLDEFNKKILRDIDENNILRVYISQIDEEREYLKSKLQKLNELILNRIYLVCEYEDKDYLKKLGGRWDRERKMWYIDNNNVNKNIILEKYKPIIINNE